MSDAQAQRAAILTAMLETSNFGEEPQPGTLYIPLLHQQRLTAFINKEPKQKAIMTLMNAKVTTVNISKSNA